MPKDTQIIGFGRATANRCLVYGLSHLEGVLSGELSVDSIAPILTLSLDDEDAMPFEYICAERKDSSEISQFVVGFAGYSHAQMERLFVANILHGDCIRISVSHAGRLWMERRFLILKSYQNLDHQLSHIKARLRDAHIDINDYFIIQSESIETLDSDDWGFVMSSPCS